jgi:uncharacterized protein (DUF305 family)
MRSFLTIVVAALALGGAPAAQSDSAQKPADQQSHQGHSMTMTDGDFAHLMSQHHRGGIEMAKMEESSGANADIKALAARIRQGQEKDVPELQAHAKKHKTSSRAAQHEKEMQKEHSASMAKMKSARGEALDRAFVTEMIKHHQSGLEMIKQTQFKDQQLKAIADKIAASQGQELQELQQHQNH